MGDIHDMAARALVATADKHMQSALENVELRQEFARLKAENERLRDVLSAIWANPSNRSWLASGHGTAIRAALGKDQ